MDSGIVGREEHLAVIASFLDRVPAGPTALLMEGEAGAGKTTLWRAAVGDATERGIAVRSCRPAEGEADLTFSGLGDLFDGDEEESLAGLPEPQRRALAAALMRSADEAGADWRAAGMALTGVLRRQAADGGLLVAIDDVQWLDPATARVLAFALRRVEGHGVGVLLARRTPAGAPAPLDVDRALPPGALTRLEVGPLTLRELHRLIRDRLGRPAARPALIRIHGASGGNALFALELAHEWLTDEGAPGDGPPPVPASLVDAVAGRLGRLDPGDRDVLLVVAASARPTEVMVEAQPGGADALRRAREAGLVETRRGRVRFTHPLIGSVLVAGAGAAARRRAHAALAELADDAEERARHLALARTTPDAGLADALEDAAHSASARGAPHSAVDLLELAIARSPAGDRAIDRRRIELAGLRFRTGDATAARALAESVLPDAHGEERARTLLLLAEIEHEAGSPERGRALCEDGLAMNGLLPATTARLHATAALVGYDDFETASHHARAALAIIDDLPDADPAVTCMALEGLVYSDLLLGRGFRRAEAERAVALEARSAILRVADRPSAAMGAWLAWVDEIDAARVALDAALRAVREEGDDSSLPYALSHIPMVELRGGDWGRARAVAEELLEISEGTGQEFQRGQALYLLGLVAAHQGDLDLAERVLGESLDIALAARDDWGEATAQSALGFTHLARGDAARARGHLERSAALCDALGVRDVGQRRESILLVEALIDLGEIAPARALCEGLARDARALDRPAWRARTSRDMGLILAAEGDLGGALAALDEAFTQHERLRFPFDLGQTLLALGHVQRRRRQRSASRDAFTRALEIFEELGARPWAERARAELERSAGRAVDGDVLTDGERRVAELAASGLTNREVAARLFISAKTVEANLARVYRKLGIRSRAELGRRMGADSAEDPPA